MFDYLPTPLTLPLQRFLESPLVSILSPSLHPPKLRLRLASILQVDIQTKVREIQEFPEESDFD